MRKSLDRVLIEAWNSFSGNFVLIVPAIGVTILNILVYGGMAALFAALFLQDFTNFSITMTDPDSFPLQEFFDIGARFFYYVAGMGIILFLYSLAVGILHGAGWSNMFAKSVENGETGFGDYFEGIARFSSRMLWLKLIRAAILWIPALFILILAIFAGAMNEGGLPISGVVFFPGMALVLLIDAALVFATMMWRPAMFIRDLPVMDAFFEGLRFLQKHLGTLFIFIILMFAFNAAFGIVTGGFNSILRFAGSGDTSNLARVFIPFMIIIKIFSGFILLCFRSYFTVLYYGFYHDEYDAPDPEPTPPSRPTHPAYPVAPPRCAPYPAIAPTTVFETNIPDVLPLEESGDNDYTTGEGEHDNNPPENDTTDKRDKTEPLPPDFC